MSDDERRAVDFSALAGADRIVVTTNMNQELVSTTDADVIAAVARWMGERAEGWYVPENGVVVSKTRVNFFAGRRSLGNVGVGERYLTAHRRGGFYQRDADPGDGAELFGLLGFASPGW